MDGAWDAYQDLQTLEDFDRVGLVCPERQEKGNGEHCVAFVYLEFAKDSLRGW
jgi:hypothetical protein